MERYLQRGADARARQIVTPEGVPLAFTLAGAGERITAFILDTIFMIVAIFMAALVMLIAGGGVWLEALLLVFVFVLRNFYFVIFETRWQGSTPGKRIVGIRVVDARGGQLDAGAILARNLVREIEVWQPLAFLIAGHEMWPNAPTWAKFASGAWLVIFMLMPLFNRDRLRIGDIIGGTRVVQQPKTMMVPDLADPSMQAVILPGGFLAPAHGPTFPFTAEQLDVYGIFELQVLEGVLRGGTDAMANMEALTTVAQRIHAKIRYHVPVMSHQYDRFLRDFYTALRAHLEKKMLFGVRREDKNSPGR